MKKQIPLSVPVIRGNEWKYVKECLDTGWVSYVGSYVDKFESKVAGYLGAKYAAATVNGTCALHVSLLACGVKPGDEVIVPALTFIAPVNAVRYCGAEPVFIDCDAETLCIDPGKTAEFINKSTVNKKGFRYNKRSGKRIKALIPVHVFGHPTDMDPLMEACSKNNIDLIEDATESLGSEYKGKKTGTFGIVGCLSFNGNKIITTGGGGMVVTDNKKLVEKIKHVTTQAKKDPFEYDHDEIGFNYRLSNVQAAMGVAQMEKLEEYIKIKRRNAALYRDMLNGLYEIEFLWEMPWAKSNFWFYTIKVPAKDKDPIIKRMISKGIQVRPVWKLINRLPMYKKNLTYRLENAPKVYDTCVNLPCSVDLTKAQISYIVKEIKGYFRK